MRILVSDQNFGDDAQLERRLAADADVELVVESCGSEQEVAAALERHRPDVLLVQFAPVGRNALGAADRLCAIVRLGVGVDNVDVAAAAERGIVVARVPDYCVDEVADHTLALVLAVERGVVGLAAAAGSGSWSFRASGPLRRLRGRTLGLVGFGRIAQAVAARARGFGLVIAAHDPYLLDEDVRGLGAEPLGFDALVERSDVLSVHVPLTDSTRGLVDAGVIARLPAGAIVVNTARGGLVDEEALAAALRSGRLRGAALDVLESEPPTPDHPLAGVPNLVLTPHAAWYSEEAIVELRSKAVESALALLRGERPAGVVAA
jgi:D-3-phosphoglycerate dehydrogenase / 2-oxoglutarate reductase